MEACHRPQKDSAFVIFINATIRFFLSLFQSPSWVGQLKQLAGAALISSARSGPTIKA
jgi:hypothetical protein